MFDQQTIDLAELGDLAAIKIATASDTPLRCAVCGNNEPDDLYMVKQDYQHYLMIECQCCGHKADTDEGLGDDALALWNDGRPDLTGIARKLFAPKKEEDT